MEYTADNIKEIRESRGLTQQDFADSIGITRELLGQMERGQKGISKATKILIDNFLQKENNVPGEIHKEDFITSRRNKKLAVNNFLVPLIPVKAQAGFLRAIDQTVYIDGLDKYALPPGIDPYGAVWAYWEIQGDSMEPTFYDGDYILATQVPRMDWDQLRPFYTYIIVTDEKILIKRVFTKNELEWVLISDNEEKYPQQLLPVEYVKQVWVFRRHIDSKAPPPKKFEITV